MNYQANFKNRGTGVLEDVWSAGFDECIDDLLKLGDVQKLRRFYQHLNTSRYQHSLNVAYLSYLICRRFKMDYRSAARAGLLHDLYLYDWRVEKQPEGPHASAHPQVALRNARKNTQLNEIEEDAIVKHMWPMTLRLPRYKESFVVSIADKYCACCEVADSLQLKIVEKYRFYRSFFAGGVLAK